MRRLSTSFIYSFIGEISLFGFSFLLGVLTARYLGSEGKGKLWIIYNAAGLLTIIFSIRFRTALTYHLSLRKDKIREYIGFSFLVGGFVIASIMIITGYSDIFIQKYLLKGVDISWKLIGLICLSYYLWTIIISLSEGLMLFNVKAVFMGGSYLLKCCLLAIAIYFGLTFNDMIFFIGAIESIIYFFFIVLYFGFPKISNFKFTEFKSMLKYSAGSFPGAVTDFYALRIDSFFLNYFCGAAETGVYSVAVSLAGMVLYIPSALKSVLMPYIASLKDIDITHKLIKAYVPFMFTVAVIITPVVWFAVIPIYGREFTASRSLFLILLPGSICWGLFLILSADFEGRGYPVLVSKISAVGTIPPLILGFLIIPIMKSTGAAIVCTLSQMAILSIAIIVYKKVSGLNLAESFLLQSKDLYKIKKSIKNIT